MGKRRLPDVPVFCRATRGKALRGVVIPGPLGQHNAPEMDACLCVCVSVCVWLVGWLGG